MEVINNRYEGKCKLSKLVPHPENPRHGNVDEIAGSVAENGFYGAVIAQVSTGHILVGNHRYQAAIKEKADTVPVIWLDVDDERALKILLVDNRTNDLATYDNGALTALLEKVRVDGDLAGTGWNDDTFAALLARTTREAPDSFQMFDETISTEHECPKCHYKWSGGK